MDGKTVSVTKLAADKTAMPLSEDGAAPSGDVYEITFATDMASDSLLTYSYSGVTEAVFGDMNGDGRVTILDVIILLKMVLNQ